MPVAALDVHDHGIGVHEVHSPCARDVWDRQVENLKRCIFERRVALESEFLLCLAGCGELQVHHIQARGQLGDDNERNLITLCANAIEGSSTSVGRCTSLCGGLSGKNRGQEEPLDSAPVRCKTVAKSLRHLNHL